MVFDCLDTVQGYAGAIPGQSKAHYQQLLAKKSGLPVDEFLAKTPYLDQLEMVVKNIETGDLEPIIMEGVKPLLRYLKSREIEPVIVTADIAEAAALTTKPLVETGYVNTNNIHAIANIGSKKVMTTWSKAREIYFPNNRIVGVFEDSKDNLEAAMNAYDSAGYQVNQEENITQQGRVVKGNLHSLLQHLKIEE